MTKWSVDYIFNLSEIASNFITKQLILLGLQVFSSGRRASWQGPQRNSGAWGKFFGAVISP
jgi:hypothetical protein